MSERNKALSRRWFEEVWNQGKEETIDELFAPSSVGHGLGDAPLVGAEGFKPFYRLYRDAFPDLHIDVEEIVAEGDLTVTRFTVTGTHMGDSLGLAPTGRQVRATGMVMTRWQDGRIVEGWNNVDIPGMMAQLSAR
jgi:predicted ester cyclase